MKDNDIIKALECCTTGDCVHCPRWKPEYIAGDCNDFLPKVIALINRQKAEIEELREINDCRTRDMPLFYATAIREFAERLKPKLRKNAHVSPFASNLNDVIIDNLVKEMTEGEK